MLKKYLISVSILFIALAVLGGIKRRTYTDITSQENAVESFDVTVMWDEQVDLMMEIVEGQILDETNYIFKVKGTGKIDYHFHEYCQCVEVEEIYQGDGVEIGETIYIGWWGLYFFNTSVFANSGSVNFMEEGKEYLVFLSSVSPRLYENKYQYFRIPMLYLDSILCYEDDEDYYIPTQKEIKDHSVNYSLVKENEFFTETEEGMQKLIEWKKYMLETYSKKRE